MLITGCLLPETSVLLAQCNLTLNETHRDILCNEASTGLIDLTVSGGTGPYSYLWSNNATTEDIYNISAGSYSVIVIDALGCTANTSVLISSTYPVLLSGSINTSLRQFCVGGTTIIGGSNTPYGPARGGSGSYLYTWQIDEACTGAWVDIPATNTTSYTPVAPVTTTCYRRKVTDAVCGTEVYTGAKTFEIYPDPVSQDIIPSTAGFSVCSGTFISGTFTGGSGGIPGSFSDTYEYSTNGGTNWNSYVPGQQITTTGLSGINLIQIRTRRIPSGVAGCNYGQYVVDSWNINPLPECSIAGADGPVCPSSANIYSAPAGMRSYAWTVTGNGSATVLNAQNISVRAGTICNASFTMGLTITDNNGCVSVCTKTVNVTDFTAPVIICPVVNQTFCATASANYTIPTTISASDNCGGAVNIKFQITGATTRTGTGNDASGTFNAGNSAITWSAEDACGNKSTCTTNITINPIPVTSPIYHR